MRTFDWRTGYSLYAHDLKLNMASFDLQNNFGVELFRSGKINDSLPYFEKSILLNPDWWTSYNNAGVIYQRQGNQERAKLYFEKSIENGDYYLAYENLAFLLLKTEGEDVALECLKIALGKLPESAKLNQVAALAFYK